jgi:hypothetical protein
MKVSRCVFKSEDSLEIMTWIFKATGARLETREEKFVKHATKSAVE